MVVVFDVVELILLKSGVKDLLQWKSACKSWYSLISSNRFVKAHLKNMCNDDYELGHKRICIMSDFSKERLPWKIVGSSNGLICVSPLVVDARLFVSNPSTREVRKLPMAPLLPKRVTNALCFSFGYDSSTDDYKVVMGILQDNYETLVQVFSLKLNIWKVIGQLKYAFYYRRSGILLNGAIHWFAVDYNANGEPEVIVSFNLSREEFKVIPQPDDPRYKFDHCKLGIYQDCLCIYCSDDHPCREVWVLRNYSVKQSWELLPNDSQMNFDGAYYMQTFKDCVRRPEKTSCCDDNICFVYDNNISFSKIRKHIGAPLFVQSLVSPYVYGRPSHTKDNKRSVEAGSGEEGHESVGTTKSGSRKRNRKRSRFTSSKVRNRKKL
ncbi:F-box/kelch-repeat protein-like protein isoform X1 [Tanacetum coccineum]